MRRGLTSFTVTSMRQFGWGRRGEGGGWTSEARSHGDMVRPDYGDLSHQSPWLGHFNC